MFMFMPVSKTLPPPERIHAPRQQRGRQRQDALIRAGLHLTSTRHWDDVKVADIAAEIGCSIGTFYTRFHTKAAYFEVLVDLVTQAMQEASSAFFAAPERALETEHEFLHRWVALGLQSFTRHRGLYATAIIELRRKSAEEALQSPLLRFRENSRAQFLHAMARWPHWQGDEAREQLLFAFQILQGVLINAVLTNPGPLYLQDPALQVHLTAVLARYLGVQQQATSPMRRKA